MPLIDMQLVTNFVNDNIDTFHQNRVLRIQSLRLNEILKLKNPYLFRAKNIESATQLIDSILDAYLSSSEETMFGQFLELLAIYVCELAYAGQKSSAAGIDLEFVQDNVRYVVAIKSSTKWGNSSQYQALRENFKRASKVLRQSQHVAHVQPVLGMCYGKARDSDMGDYIKKCGQSFWTFISGSPSLYIDIIQPLGYRAEERNTWYRLEKQATVNRLLGEFIPNFCFPDGHLDWAKLVAFNSGNLSER